MVVDGVLKEKHFIRCAGWVNRTEGGSFFSGFPLFGTIFRGMAYVPGFLHDVFLSYACADDIRADGVVGHFWTLLTASLRAEGLPIKDENTPDGVDVFLDRRRLKAGADLTDQVLSGARSSAIFVAFHSVAYLQSTWCQKEAEEFCGNYDERRPKLNGRLFVISFSERGNPKHSTIAGLKARRFRRFYYVNEDGRDYPFEPVPGGQVAPKNTDGYTLKQEAIDMAREIADTLREMQKETAAPQVFLAATSPARQAQAEDIKNWLVQQRVTVLRTSPDEGDWLQESRDLMAGASLFVDLHEAAPFAPAAEQGKIAAELKKPRIRWAPRGEVSPEAAQAVMGEISVIEENLEDFKEALKAMLSQPSERHKPATAGPAGTPEHDAMVLLIGANKDEPCVLKLEQKLDEFGCGRDAFLKEDIFENPDNWRKELQELLQHHQPTGVVFVDGDCQGPWADKRLRDLLVLLPDVAPRAKPALCLFPPDNKSRRYRPRATEVRRLDSATLEGLADLLKP